MYYKGSNMLHTLRQLLEDDNKWREILRGINKQFYHQTVTTQQIEDYLSQQTGKDLSAMFNQYLRTSKIPVLEYELVDGTIKYRYSQVVENFDMPLRIFVNKKEKWLFPTTAWKSEKLDKTTIPEFDPNFYVIIKPLN